MQALPSKHIDLATIPNPDEASLPYHLQSTGIFREDLLNTYQNLYKIQPHYGKQAEAKDLGIESVLVADEAYSHGDVDQGQFFSATARGFLDIAIGIDPLTGSIRGAYELVTGRNMITGEQLSNLERGISAIRCIPLGGGVIIGGGEAIIVGLGRLTRFVRVIRSDVEMIRTAVRFSQFIQDGARGRTVQTFREIAPQQMSPPALIARARVLEGSTVYRIGTRGENYTGNTAQYWSFENPVNNPTYGARYGMPQENFAGADFVETATVRPNIEFITRPAPPVGANPGGGIEVVVPVGGTIPGGHFSL
jgi:hypothetical protein